MKKLIVIALSFTAFSLHLVAQETIADSVYNDDDWRFYIETEFDANEFHEQRVAGGNPDSFRYMIHTLSAPPGDEDLTFIRVVHIYFDEAFLAFGTDIDHIDFAEDVRLLNLSWNQAWVISYPAIRQGGKLYRATEGISVIGDTLWHHGEIAGLTSDDFIALDGTDDKPDFTTGGGFLYFGFVRFHTRSRLLPPIPVTEDLVYEHGSDNLTITIWEEPPENSPPIARADDYLYLDFFNNSIQPLPVLENDSDPDDDPVYLSFVDEPNFGGVIESYDSSTISYRIDQPTFEEDFFTYRISDGQEESSLAFVRIYFCICPLECVGLFLAPPPAPAPEPVDANPILQKVLKRTGLVDSLDIDLFRQLRDEVLLTNETGSAFVDLYYHFAPEIMPLLILQRADIGRQAFNALGMMQAPVDNLLNGDGTEVISQQLVDSVSVFFDSLIVASSDTLHAALDSVLTRLCTFQNLVGVPVADAVMALDCDTMSTQTDHLETSSGMTVLRQNYPNPFMASSHSGGTATTMTYYLPRGTSVRLEIFDIYGGRIRTLTNSFEQGGESGIGWDGTNAFGEALPSGVYFYRLSTDTFQQTRQMILLR